MIHTARAKTVCIRPSINANGSEAHTRRNVSLKWMERWLKIRNHFHKARDINPQFKKLPLPNKYWIKLNRIMLEPFPSLIKSCSWLRIAPSQRTMRPCLCKSLMKTASHAIAPTQDVLSSTVNVSKITDTAEVNVDVLVAVTLLNMSKKD